jgi:uncharacterized protein
MHAIISPQLLDAVLTGALHGGQGIHGLEHWQRVQDNGLRLARLYQADQTVVILFALLHDSRRHNDGFDPGHGPRAAELAQQLHRQGLLPIDAEQLKQLAQACRHHTDTTFSDDLTIACCWDADRLDLTRVGIQPNPKYLNTPEAKRLATIDS